MVSYIHIYVVVYLVLAYVELLSFYLTGYDNQGKFPVTYTFLKRVLMFAFYFTVAFFLFIYTAMMFFILVWAVLAAILNPSVFLPYTAAALTLFATIGAKVVMFRLKFDGMINNFEGIVKEKLGNAFLKSLEKVKSKVKKLPGGNKAAGAIPDVDPAVQQSALQKGFEAIKAGADEP